MPEEGAPQGDGTTGDETWIQAEGPDVETSLNDADEAFLSGEGDLPAGPGPDGTPGAAGGGAEEGGEHLADLRRVTAEYANYRRRTEREREAIKRPGDRRRGAGDPARARRPRPGGGARRPRRGRPAHRDRAEAARRRDEAGHRAVRRARASCSTRTSTTRSSSGRARTCEKPTVSDVVERGYRIGDTDPPRREGRRRHPGRELSRGESGLVREGLLQGPRRRQVRLAGRPEEGLPAARPAVPPGLEPGRHEGRVAVQGDLRGLQRALRRAAAAGVRPDPGDGLRRPLHRGRRGRAGRRLRGRVRQPVRPGRAHPARAPAGGGGFEDILGGMFGGGGAGGFGQPSGGFRGFGGPTPGRDVTATTSIDFLTATKGDTVTLSGGEGKPITVRIPAGVTDGQKLKLRGKGEPSPDGGEAGDLVLTVRVDKHPVFERDGLNLRVNVPVTFAEAALGATIEVPTLGGETVRMKVPRRHLQRPRAAAQGARRRDQDRAPATCSPGSRSRCRATSPPRRRRRSTPSRPRRRTTTRATTCWPRPADDHLHDARWLWRRAVRMRTARRHGYRASWIEER